MFLDNKGSIKLSELINWVKKELLSDEARRNDPVPLFIIDEVTVEVNFVLTGEGEGGFNLVVVKADSKVGEERVQKAIVRMRPIVPPDQLAAEFATQQPQVRQQVLNEAVKVLLKGATAADSESVPTRE